MKPTLTEIFHAAILGTMAFKAGKKRIPYLDVNLNKMYEGRQVGDGGIALSKAWLRAWDDTNLFIVLSN